HLLYFLLIGALAGWLAGHLTKGRGFGPLGNVILGILGAIFGGFIIGLLGFSATGGLLPQLVTATLGSLLLLYLIQHISPKR
ncbi:MAG: GlsB/YeaQ/YmgE family stress response membrane protein, partial [Bacillota bacterium]